MRHVFFVLLLSMPAFAGEFENLKVLPEDISKPDLNRTMKAWSKALGVRCNFCHVGEAGAPLSTYDFVSDENKHKKIARQMVELTRDLNNNLLKKIDDDASMNCRSCHRGVAHPRTLEQQLAVTMKRRGLDSALKQYDSLRERYYGSDGYDFTEDSLNSLAYRLIQEKNADAAIKFLDINLGYYPKSAHAHFLMGDALASQGKKAEAIEHLETAAKLDPENESIAKKLAELR